MRFIMIGFILFLTRTSLHSQNKFDKSTPLNGISRITGQFEWGDVTIKNWNGTELKVIGTLSVNLGENNDAFSLEFERKGGMLEIHSTIKDWKSLPQYLTIFQGEEQKYFKVGSENNIDWPSIKKKHGEAGHYYSVGILVDIDLTILVPVNQELDVTTKYGSLEVLECKNPIKLKSIYGHLIADLSSRDAIQSCNLESTYSFVDVSIPAGGEYDLSIITNYGQIYSDLDIKINENLSIDKIFESKVVGDINNGGAPLSIQATYNNVYLRRKI
ncbi:MAG: hypothetical protein IPL46_23530 [Saprospiraceae bacterium]|nr:hypothetical protein [Saprospiraceae bacterium]